MSQSERATLSRRGLLVGGFAVIAAPNALLAACATAASSAPNYAQLQALIDSYVSTHRLPSVVIAVKRGTAPVRYLKGGTLALNGAAPADENSIYRQYSMSKPVTAIAAMQLIERGQLTLDTAIADFIPEFGQMRVLTDLSTMSTRPANGYIRVRHLMTHTSGLSYHINQNSPLSAIYRRRGITPQGGHGSTAAIPGQLPVPPTLDEFGRIVGDTPLARDPGTAYEYSIGLDVLGLVIQRASNMPFATYLQRSIFEPLGMNDTGFAVSDAQAPRFVTNYTISADGALTAQDDAAESPYRNYTGMPCGGAGLVSTAKDYAQFASALLSDGIVGTRRIFSIETGRLAHSNLMPQGVFAGGNNGFGAGMQVQLPGGTADNRAPIGSYGWSGAAGTAFWVDPAANSAVVMMINHFGGRLTIRRELGETAYADFGL